MFLFPSEDTKRWFERLRILGFAEFILDDDDDDDDDDDEVTPPSRQESIDARPILAPTEAVEWLSWRPRPRTSIVGRLVQLDASLLRSVES